MEPPTIVDGDSGEVTDDGGNDNAATVAGQETNAEPGRDHRGRRPDPRSRVAISSLLELRTVLVALGFDRSASHAEVGSVGRLVEPEVPE
jgi:hypothetical protein